MQVIQKSPYAALKCSKTIFSPIFFKKSFLVSKGPPLHLSVIIGYDLDFNFILTISIS